MKALMLRHAFRFVNRVVFLVGPHNARSKRALEKIGAVRAGSRQGAGGRENLVYELIAGRAGMLPSDPATPAGR